MSPVETLASLNKTSLEALTTVQDRIVAAYQGATSFLPTDWIPATPLVPLTRGYLAQVIEESYAFQTKVLEANKSFAARLLDAASPAPAPAKATGKAPAKAAK
ncbi:MAG TPA: hypothetical protein VFH30_09275 [Acidimicrobiales bacterium]|jgi:hypothetical protein|nr:hypothetical protein [Acidimicrobiales bacterium]